MKENSLSRSPCPLANSLDILGDKWTLLIIRDLLITDRREFGHFLYAGEGISTNILTERLERLQHAGLITKQPHPEHGKKFIYELTDSGLALAPTIIEMTLWGHRHLNNTDMPRALLSMMKNKREKLLLSINHREPLIRIIDGD